VGITSVAILLFVVIHSFDARIPFVGARELG
jgi:hypothetical protein